MDNTENAAHTHIHTLALWRCQQTSTQQWFLYSPFSMDVNGRQIATHFMYQTIYIQCCNAYNFLMLLLLLVFVFVLFPHFLSSHKAQRNQKCKTVGDKCGVKNSQNVALNQQKWGKSSATAVLLTVAEIVGNICSKTRAKTLHVARFQLI